MKKWVCVILSAGMLALTACAGNGNTNTQANADAVTTLTSQDGGTEVTEGEQPKTLYGEISEVIGNALIIKEIAMPEIPEGVTRFSQEDMENMTEFTLPDGTSIPIGEDGRPDFSNVEMPEGMTFDTEGGGNGMVFGGSTGLGDMTEEERMQMFGGNGEDGNPVSRRMERNYTGEEVEVIIPVGIPIMTRTRGEEGIEEKEVTLSNLASGDIVTITYKEDGTNIDTVYVVQSSAGGGGMMGEFFFAAPGGPEMGGGGDNVVIFGGGQ